MTRAHELRIEIKDLKKKVQDKEQELDAIERACNHTWSKPVDVSEHIPGYHFAGDPPGTMGVDRQLPYDVPPQTIEKWARVCERCGKTETTTRIEVAEVVRRPVF